MQFVDEGNDEAIKNRASTGFKYSGPEILSFRTDWKDTRGSFIAMKGGENQAAHAHLDQGSFHFESDAFEWFKDIGVGSYSLPGYFGSRDDPNSGAYKIYRIRAEGHNTVLLNPTSAPDQDIFAVSKISRFQADKNMGSVDLTPAYKNQATKLERGITLVNYGKAGKQAGVVKDNLFAAKGNQTYYWQAHTKLSVQGKFLDSTRRSFVLEQDRGGDNPKSRLLVYVLEPELSFQSKPDGSAFGSPLLDAHPLPSTPVVTGQTLEMFWKKVQIKATVNKTDLSSTVVMVPLFGGDLEVIPVISDARLKSKIADWGWSK
jgi:Heparinase II/III-like protein